MASLNGANIESLAQFETFSRFSKNKQLLQRHKGLSRECDRRIQSFLKDLRFETSKLNRIQLIYQEKIKSLERAEDLSPARRLNDFLPSARYVQTPRTLISSRSVSIPRTPSTRPGTSFPSTPSATRSSAMTSQRWRRSSQRRPQRLLFRIEQTNGVMTYIREPTDSLDTTQNFSPESVRIRS